VFVMKDQEKFIAIWNAVFIRPDEWKGKKRTFLKSVHYSTDEGTIENIVIQGNVISFELILSPKVKVQVVCIKKGEYDYDIKGNGLYWNDLLKNTVSTKWLATENIVLPSLEVYGQGDDNVTKTKSN